MTRIDRSPEQLNAEAAAPEDRDLTAAIAAHRTLFRAETGILRLHQRDGESGLGPPFSHLFESFLDERFGGFPWHRALLYLRHRVCRVTHTKHWERAEWNGSLCYELVSYVVRRDTSLDYARLQLGLPEEGKTRRTLDSALLVMERRLEAMLSEDRAKQSYERPAAEWMAAPHEHRPLDGLHRVDCPQCARAA